MRLVYYNENTTPLQISSRGFNRESVQRGIKMGIEKLKTIKERPKNGAVLFSGVIRYNDNTSSVCELFFPPLPVKQSIYKCDKVFHTEYVEELYEYHKKYGYCVIVNESAIIVTQHGSEIKIIKKINASLSTESRRGGQSANRIARLRQENKNNFKNKIIDNCVINIEGLIVAGNADLPKEIFGLIKADTRITCPILGFIKTSSTNINTALQEATQYGKALIDNSDMKMETEEIIKVQHLIETDPDKLVFGEDQIKKCDGEYLLSYVITNYDIQLNCTVKKIQSKKLDDYNIIGILYCSNSANYINGLW